jgi:hypothetical protein
MPNVTWGEEKNRPRQPATGSRTGISAAATQRGSSPTVDPDARVSFR